MIFLQEKAAETAKLKEDEREKPKPEEHKDMPQHQHCPLAIASRRCEPKLP
jgi:hypothetical protein